MAAAYKAIGINMFLGLHLGPTDTQLDELEAAGMSTTCAQNAAALARPAAPVVAWTYDGDAPDNAQLQENGSYGPCIPPADVQQTYAAWTTADRTRPVVLQLGQGVAVDAWVGRGSDCAGRVDMYPEYIKAGDILSFHVYPNNSTDPITEGKPWLLATGVDRLRAWSRYQKLVWTTIETTPFDDPARRPTPAQIKAQVWMSLVHGAMGIVYFVHVFNPSFIEAGLLADPTNSAAVASINQQIRTLAPALNSPSLGDVATVTSSDPRVPIDFAVKRLEGATYLFAVAMRDGAVTATVSLPGIPRATAEVLDEGRTIPVFDGKFQDSFAGYAVHLYKIVP
jgi:hypothetical protein